MTLLLILLMCYQGQDAPSTPAAKEKKKAMFVDRIAIKVNDKIITERELVFAYKQRRRAIMANFSGAELDEKLKKAWNATVKELEENLLLFEKAVELGIAPSEDDVRSRMMGIKESNGMSDEEFEEALRAQTGMNLDEYVSSNRLEQSVQYVVQSQIISKIRVDESEIAKYYTENIDQYMNPETYQIAEIVFLKSSPNVQARVAECHEFLKSGGDFAEAAKKYSDSASKENGGDLGMVNYGDFNEAIEDRVRKMEKGQVSDSFETSTAIFIIKILEKTPKTPKAREEVREQILETLRYPRMEKEMVSFIEDLKGRYLLQTYLKEAPWYLEL